MANAEPANDTRAVTDYILAQARAAGAVRVYPIGAVTRGLGGKEMAGLAELAAAGWLAFFPDGRLLMKPALHRRAVVDILTFGCPLASHATDTDTRPNVLLQA